MKKFSRKQIVVILVIACIVLLNILALIFTLIGSELTTKLGWICFILSILIPFFIFIHFKVLDIIRMRVDKNNEKANEQAAKNSDLPKNEKRTETETSSESSENETP